MGAIGAVAAAVAPVIPPRPGTEGVRPRPDGPDMTCGGTPGFPGPSAPARTGERRRAPLEGAGREDAGHTESAEAHGRRRGMPGGPKAADRIGAAMPVGSVR
ncbi:hypothetical protein SAMN04489764_2607 [Thermostaphylospora chromogena]|uniref:Uncharacterized protein n=1 Tax=Thermostaphylospora chromogena TaxID=35622 RepID=A0A1H1ETX1_9ACTN|nr:hypothetical protein SAMN04489764_2607 [Thermostaphylospora chromogena]